MKSIKHNELSDLKFGDKIKVVWDNTPYHYKNETYTGIIFGDNIGWEDGKVDTLRIIAESICNNYCRAYLICEEEDNKLNRTKKSIKQINAELDKISNLDGVVADKIEQLQRTVEAMVSDILENHPEASKINYWGNSKSGINNILEQIRKEPILEEILNKGEVIVSKTYHDEEEGRYIDYQIIKYKGKVYYIEHKGLECTANKRIG